ncbi:hypothetical protein [Cyanothece sp. BG0011]|uniref:hypothetical protein n=1 Tax=Cyanothece sp. BG0011 TaxID=2082950 RepID=UPI0013005962|nr:hypothetical protein [Cyanothece sp. BG0011]
MESQHREKINSKLKLRAFKINNIINWMAAGLRNDQIKVQARNFWKLSELQFDVLLRQAKEQLKEDLPCTREERLTALFAQAHLICQDTRDSQESLMVLDGITLEIELLLESKPIYEFPH